MSREQNIQDKDSFFQAGRILLKKVHKVESIDSEDVLLFWKEVEDRLESKCSQRLRIRYVFSAERQGHQEQDRRALRREHRVRQFYIQF